MESAAKRRRYSLDPDLKIEVEGAVFEVHAKLLMLASPVFRSMLESGMNETEEGVIHLPGKRKAEFESVLPFISTLGSPAVQLESVPMLLRWADEYDIEVLRKACEQELMKQDPSVNLLQLAVRCNLAACQAKCIDAITADLRSHLDDLEQLSDDSAVMQAVLPAIFNTTKVLGKHVVVKRTSNVSTRTFWPFIRAAILDSLDAPYSSCPDLKRGDTVRVLSNVARLRHLCKLSDLHLSDDMALCAGEEVEILQKTFKQTFRVRTDHSKTSLRLGSERGKEVVFPWTALCPLPKGL